MSDIEAAVAAVQEKMSGADAFGSSVLFDFGDGSGVYVDGTESPPAVSAASGDDADCTITADQDTFKEMIAGDLDPTSAFMTGRIKVDGDMSAAMAISRVLG